MEAYPFELRDFDPEVDKVTSEVVAPSASRADRSVARRACLQILYELDSTQHPAPLALESHLTERPDSYRVRQVIRRIVGGVIADRERIDDLIQAYAPDFPVNQIAIIDRNILRIAIFEYLVQQRVTPVPVIVNEAVHLAQVFGAENAHSFVHGVLCAITETEPSAPAELEKSPA